MSDKRPNIRSAPYVSVVACSRNDDHGGNLLHRMQLFVNGLINQCRRHQLRAELILVEWNPPANRSSLKDALSWPSSDSFCDIRIIQVPAEIHGRFKHSDGLPVFQMIAKNVGIRRARSRFLLATNIDILFSDELMSFLASGRLKEKRMYRIDRYDASSDIPADASIEEQLAFCRNNVIRVNGRNGTRNLHSGDYHEIYPVRARPSGLRALISRQRQIEYPEYTRLHTNACGDFTLMSRESWLAVRGYPEFEMYSFHLDSLLCHAAYHSGTREEVLNDPMRIYHIEHGSGSGFTPEGEQHLDGRLKAAGVPKLTDDEFAVWAIRMRREGRPIIFNDEKWGLAGEGLPETVIGEDRQSA